MYKNQIYLKSAIEIEKAYTDKNKIVLQWLAINSFIDGYFLFDRLGILHFFDNLLFDWV